MVKTFEKVGAFLFDFFTNSVKTKFAPPPPPPPRQSRDEFAILTEKGPQGGWCPFMWKGYYHCGSREECASAWVRKTRTGSWRLMLPISFRLF